MRAVLAIAFVLAVAAVASAQDERIGLPIALRGDVHRIVRSGCGQAWTGDEARSTVALTVDAGGRARLAVDGHVRSASGGVSLLDEGGRYHAERASTRTIVWTGRARVERGVLVVRLRALVETVPVDGSPLTVTNRTTEEAVLRCVREARDVLAAEPPDRGTDGGTDGATDAGPVGRRSPFACTFDPREHEGPLPRPVAELLTPPFLLDTGAGITTGATYEASVGREATSFVAREPSAPP